MTAKGSRADRKGMARYRERPRLEQNDKCFYCGLRMGLDCTVEHLLAKKLDGGNNYGNLRVCHSKCNGLVGHLPVDRKLSLHWIGMEEGSDAFFAAVERENYVRLSKKRGKTARRIRRKRMRQALTENRDYRTSETYRAGYAMLSPAAQALFESPLEPPQNAGEAG